MDLQCGDVKKTHSNLVGVFAHSQNKFWLVTLVRRIVCALSNHVTNLAMNNFVALGDSRTLRGLFLSSYSFRKLSRILSLLHNCNFEAMVYKDLQIFVEHFFWEPNMQFFCASHPIEVQQALANDCVLVKDLVKLA